MTDTDRSRARRRTAKATLDFATGEVHDRLIDAAGNPESLAPEQPSGEAPDAPQLGSARPEKGTRAAPKSQRRWVKARNIP